MDPITAARGVLQRYWDKKLPVNHTAIVYAMGGRIVFDPALADDGHLEAGGEGKFLVRLYPFRTLVQQRFTVFRELGHFVLGHGPESGTGEGDRQGRSGLEVALANAFAAEMILPRDHVRYFVDRTRLNLESMADVFHVSVRALEIRLSKLGMLPAAQDLLL